MNVAIVEFLSALVPAWMLWKKSHLAVVARNGRSRLLLVLMHISGLVLLYVMIKLYSLETRPAESKK